MDILIPYELLPGMLWRFPLRSCWNPTAAVTCYMGQGVLSSEGEWDIITLMDKSCYLQAGLIQGVTLPHKRILLFVCLFLFFMPSHLVLRSAMSAVIRQWEGLLWKVSELGEGMSCSWSPPSENQRQSPRHSIEELNLSDCTSWVLGQGSRDLNWGSQLLMPKHSSPTEPWQCTPPWKSTILWIFLSLENTSSFMR